MTVNEIAVFLKKNETTVTRWIKKAIMQNAELKLQNAGFGEYGHDYSIEEVEVILNASSMSRDAVSILMQNARSKSTSTEVSQNNDCLTRAFENMTRAFEYISKTQAMQEERLSKLEHNFEERKALLPAPGIKPRDHINMLARSYAKTTETSIKEAYGELYRQFAYRTNSNPRICAQNRGMAILDYIETEGQIEVLESVAMEIFA